MVHLRKVLPAQSVLGQTTGLAFLALFFIVTASAIYRFSVLDANDPYKCRALVKQGAWLNPSQGFHNGNNLQNWQPPGCMMHEYAAKDIWACLESRRVVFAGDSTTRQIFWAMAKKLDATGAESELERAEKHEDLSFERAGVELEFIWDPFLNSTKLQEELNVYQNLSGPSDKNRNEESAALILVGGGLWHAQHIDVGPLKHFKDAVDNLIPFMRPMFRESASQPSLTYPGQKNLFLLAPVQVPLYESLSPSRAVSMTPEKISPMNEYLEQLSTNQGIEVLWSYSLMTWQKTRAYEDSGLHVVENVATSKADVLLNLRCNAGHARSGTYPFDRTCCSNYSRPGWIQFIFFMSGIGVLPSVITLITIRESKRISILPSSKMSRALLALGLSLCYCFCADRTQIFNKVQKQFSSRDFKALCAITFAMGLSSLRRSSSSSTARGVFPEQRLDQPFLSREQTDEWKGWMQFMILIYHYTGASKVLWIYEIVRLLVASYLFMTGFGHTVFFYQKGDYSFSRFASVLVRLNLLSCLLPYMMRTDYLFYYFAPLVTFWFVVVYLTMKLGHARNNSFRFLSSKILVSAVFVTALTRSPGILEAIFLVLRYTFKIHWDVREWRFRVLLDMYIVYIGMLAGIVFIKISDALRKDSINNRVLNFIRDKYGILHTALVAVCLIVMPSFWVITRRSPNKYDYNWWHPYISCLPIVSYIILRNSNRHFRNYHSSVFAWLGRCSLETFTLQFHIWLAGDTKGLISLGFFNREGSSFLNGRREDFVLFTAIFLWLSWHVSRAVGTITSWIIDPGRGKRNLDLDLEDSSVGSQSLPRTKSHEDLEQQTGKTRLGTTSSVTRLFATLTTLLRHDLRARLALILLVMWFFNLTYT